MPRIEMNWANVAFGLILLSIAAIAAVTYYFIDQRRLAVADAHQRRAFDAEMATVELPEWNGDTYDWTPESLAYLADPDAYGQEQEQEPVPTLEFPVPDSVISGPMPVMGAPAEDDADEFLTKLKTDNAAFLASFADRAGD
jgi:hypothetical protein